VYLELGNGYISRAISTIFFIVLAQKETVPAAIANADSLDFDVDLTE
jgi:hypothetical protein